MTEIALLLVAFLAIPHLVSATSVAPPAGVVIWLSVLTLRAALAICAAIIFIFYVPASEIFDLVTRWCVHAVVPFFATHLGFSGHSLGDAAALVPGVALALSMLAVSVGVWRAARAMRHWLGGAAVGTGPSRSVIVGGGQVRIAAVGIRKPQVVVSAATLVALDDAELAAGLAHERAHIERGHPYLRVLARVLWSVARFVPGSSRALAELDFQLERDADERAVRRTGDPLALGSAICKSAISVSKAPEPAESRLTGGSASARVRALTEHGHVRHTRVGRALGPALAAALATAAVAAVVSLPVVADAGAHELVAPSPAPTCRA